MAKPKVVLNKKKSSKSTIGGKDADAQKTSSIRFNKEKGQHILKNPLIVTGMVEKAGVKSTDTVLEVGPGTGNLTAKLLEKAKKVNAFEIDPRMVAELQKRFQGTPQHSKLEIFLGDVIKAEKLPFFDLCVANLPYQISSPFILRLMRSGGYRCAVIMLQKEFADRLLARPGDKLYSRLSANVQLHCRVDHLIKVSKNSFRPPPRVESAVVRLEPRHPKPPVTFAEWDGLLRIVFSRKNKTLASNLKTRHVLDLLAKNYATLRAGKAGKGGATDTAVTAAMMLPRVLKVLSEAGMAGFRARTMDEDDLLRLLLMFKKADILFG